MRDETGRFGQLGGSTWIRRLDSSLAGAVGQVDFDVRFVRHLVRLLDTAGLSNIAYAILRSTIEISNGREDREEFDALIDLGIELMSRHDRPFRPLAETEEPAP